SFVRPAALEVPIPFWGRALRARRKANTKCRAPVCPKYQRQKIRDQMTEHKSLGLINRDSPTHHPKTEVEATDNGTEPAAAGGARAGLRVSESAGPHHPANVCSVNILSAIAWLIRIRLIGAARPCVGVAGQVKRAFWRGVVEDTNGCRAPDMAFKGVAAGRV